MALLSLSRAVTAARVVGYARVTLVLFAVLFGGWLALSLPTLTDPTGKPLGYDFLAFWSGSWLAQDGRAAEAYGLAAIGEAHAAALGRPVAQLYLWHYPPTYFPFVWPLAWLPYPLALLLFVGLTGALYLAAARAIVPDRRALLPILAAPAGLVCLMHGQNGFLTAGLIGFALLWLDRRPLAAGAAIGLLAFKPHLAVLFPLVLALEGRWRTFWAAAVSALALTALSWALVGPETFLAFLDNLPLAKSLIDLGALPWAMMPSVYAGGLLIGLAPGPAMALHAASAVAAAAAVAVVWRAGAPLGVKAAALCAGSLLISPYVFFYDMTVLGLAIAFLAAEGLRGGVAPRAPAVLALAWATPLLMLAAAGLHLPLGPVAIWAVLGLTAAQARRPSLAVALTPPRGA